MPFVVSVSGARGKGTFRAEKATRKDALETAVNLTGLGDVTITDEKGRVFKPSEFAEFSQLEK